MVYKGVRGWTSGRSLPVLKFVKYPPPPPGKHDSKLSESASAPSDNLLPNEDVDITLKKVLESRSRGICTANKRNRYIFAGN